jgi:hypothetical protein
MQAIELDTTGYLYILMASGITVFLSDRLNNPCSYL